MYCEKILNQLKSKKISIGDRISVNTDKGDFVGLLMPRPYYGDCEVLVLKLDSGYNVGLRPNSIDLIEHSATRDKKHHEKHTSQSKEGSVAILGCGGTIASKIEYKTGAASPSISPDELRASFPDLARFKVHSKSVFSLFSEDFNHEHWKIIASEVASEIKDGSSGVVIMHGTDTMSYTSAALSFMLQNLPIPVVLVGSQRSSDRPSSENESNLINAVYAANQDYGEVSVCMHATSSDDYCYIHRGSRVRKMHSSRRDAFRSINCRPLFAVDYRQDRFEPLEIARPKSKTEKFVFNDKLNDNVSMVYVHPGLKPEFISKLSDYDGIVFAGLGLGHVSMNPFNDSKVIGIAKEIKELYDSGVSLVMAPQTIYGRVCMRVYTTGRMLIDSGMIGDGADWTPEAAYAKLCWVLGQTKDQKKVNELMMSDIAGEISTRSYIEETWGWKE